MTRQTTLLAPNREQWLTDAADLIRPLFTEAVGMEVPPFRVSCGFPSRAATSNTNRRIGECWHTHAVTDGQAQVFISPLLHEPLPVLETLVHEMVHVLHPEAGHKGAFVRTMRAVGLEGKPTATTAGDELTVRLLMLAEGELGAYPHAQLKLKPKPTKPQNRHLKCECRECGYVARTTRQWLDEAGPPICPRDKTTMRGPE